MQIYASSLAIEQACQTLPAQNLRQLFFDRYQQLKSDDYEIHEIVHFWVVESEADLQRLPEYLECREEHSGWTELVFVLLDDGFGLEVFVPDWHSPKSVDKYYCQTKNELIANVKTILTLQPYVGIVANTSAQPITAIKNISPDGSILKFVIWQVLKPVPPL